MMKNEKKTEFVTFIDRIFHFQWKEQKRNPRKTAVKILAGYLAVMVLLTVVSRTLKGITMPEVKVAGAVSSTIEGVTEVSGHLEYDSQKPVYLEAGLKVDQVYVQEGQSVEEGDVLLGVHMEDLQKQIIQKKAEAKAAKADYQELTENQTEQEKQQQRSMERAGQDYELARQKADFEVMRAEEARNVALDRYNIALNENSQMSETYQMAYEQAQKAYEDALWNREEMLLEAQRNLEDAKEKSGAGVNAASAKLEWNNRKEELKELKKIKKAGGKVFSRMSGLVSEVQITEGEITQESSALLLADPDGGIFFAASLNSEEERELDGEVSISVMLGTREEEFTDLQVTSRNAVGDMDDQTEIRIALPGEAAKAGRFGTLQIKSISQMYDAVVPLKALHQGESADSYYVFLVREEEGILGKQWKVQPIDVKIADKNDYYAALTSKELNYGQEIVVDTDKPLEAGDVVRLAEE